MVRSSKMMKCKGLLSLFLLISKAVLNVRCLNAENSDSNDVKIELLTKDYDNSWKKYYYKYPNRNSRTNANTWSETTNDYDTANTIQIEDLTPNSGYHGLTSGYHGLNKYGQNHGITLNGLNGLNGLHNGITLNGLNGLGGLYNLNGLGGFSPLAGLTLNNGLIGGGNALIPTLNGNGITTLAGAQRPIFLINKRSDHLSWLIPVALFLAAPIFFGAIFMPMALRSMLYAFQILRNLGLVVPLTASLGSSASTAG